VELDDHDGVGRYGLTVALPAVVEPMDVAFFRYEYTVGVAEVGVNPL
jgi:hypothetical protein